MIIEDVFLMNRGPIITGRYKLDERVVEAGEILYIEGYGEVKVIAIDKFSNDRWPRDYELFSLLVDINIRDKDKLREIFNGKEVEDPEKYKIRIRNEKIDKLMG